MNSVVGLAGFKTRLEDSRDYRIRCNPDNRNPVVPLIAAEAGCPKNAGLREIALNENFGLLFCGLTVFANEKITGPRRV